MKAENMAVYSGKMKVDLMVALLVCLLVAL
jgi:hypothetical protein